MVDLKIQLPDGFLNEEVRCEYRVSSEMKKVWSVQLDLLNKLDEVCKKYGLVYYADSGTLIGAVRHSGYIPWDDDIDIVMMRKDYDRLLSVAEVEFKYPIFLQTAYSEKKYIRAHAQLRNSETTGCILSDVNTEYNKGIFIDIFPMDNIPDSDIELEKFKKKIKLCWKIITAPYVEHQKLIVKIISSIVGKMVPFDVAFRRYEKLCKKYDKKQTSRISYIAYSMGKEKHIWKRKWFERYHRVPFEFMEIPIPDGYDGRLKKEYGDYMVIRHAPTAHGTVFYSADIPYAEYFDKCNGEK